MVAVSIRQFRGATLRPDARLLDNAFGQFLQNGRVFRGVLTPLEGLLQVATPSKGASVKTIYRFGQDIVSDTQYWMNWLTDVDVVRGPIAGDVQERTYYTGDGVPKVTDASIALGADYPNAAYTLGLPAPASTTTLVVNGTPPASGTPETRVYVVTYVSGWGEEGPPSQATISADVGEGQTVTLNNLPTAPVGAYNVTSKRIYRSVLGSATVEYLFVKEVSVATTSTTDNIASKDLGESLPTLGWVAPPTDLKGLVALPNGVMAGFTGRDVYFCEPFHPYAWPLKYVLTCDYKIVGLGVCDTTLVVLTTGTPYYIQGTDPSNMVMVQAPVKQACVSKRSIVSAFGSVMYASPDGLVRITPGADPALLTDAAFAPGQWQAMKPESITGYLYEGYYVGFYDTGTVQAGFMLSPSGDWTSLSFYATAGYNDLQRDTLFLVSGGQIKKFAKGSMLTMTWRSKQFYLAGKGLVMAKVEAAGYPVTLAIYVDGVLRHTRVVANPMMFKLPATICGNDVEFEVQGTTEVRAIVAASTAQELRLA